MSQQRPARYGSNLYEIRVPVAQWPSVPGKLYFCADSITVREGTLMLAAEVEEHDGEAGEAAIEMPPAAIFAPGQWLSVILVGWEDHEPLFSEETWRKIQEETAEDEK